MDETYVINQVKEDVCFVSNNFKEDMETSHKKGPDNTIVQDYVLPDYTTIRRGYPLRLDQSSQNDNVRGLSFIAAIISYLSIRVMSMLLFC